MRFNETPRGDANDTVNEVIQHDENNTKMFDLYEAINVINEHERENITVFKYLSYIVGTIIILSNMTVVISSGLILKKGQQPKSTYLLLGNLSLADTIIGICILVSSTGSTVNQATRTDMMCIIQIGMLVCPVMVSIFSVGLIAVDRYIYILHGLYYQRWFNTTKVRIAIVCTWIIGAALGFMPVTGWKNHELDFSKRCMYETLFPSSVVIFNSVLSTLPIFLVGVLYSIILVKALKNVKKIKAAKSYANNLHALDKQEMKICSDTGKTNEQTNLEKNDCIHTDKFCTNTTDDRLKRSASLDDDIRSSSGNQFMKSTSVNDLTKGNEAIIKSKSYEDVVNIDVENSKNSNPASQLSVYTIESSVRTVSIESVKVPHEAKGAHQQSKCCGENPNVNKHKQPNKWRAITIVMLTSGSFVFTWLPFFIMDLSYMLCENKRYNERCHNIMVRFGAPLMTLAFFNSILNPLIYAWWHKGFKKSIRAIFKKYFRNRYSNTAIGNMNNKVKL